MKRNLFITCALGLLSCAFSAQASDPWNYYRVGSSYSSPSYTQKYDSTFGMTIKGAYGIAGDSDMPNLGGGLLSLNSYTETGDIVHELSLTAGLMSSDAKHFNAFDIGREWGYSDAQIQHFLNEKNITNVDLKIKYQTSIPLLAGYTLNLPLVQEKAYFFLGGKIGVTFNSLKATATIDRKIWQYDSTYRIEKGRASATEFNADFTFSATLGFRFAIGNTTDLILGYELLKFHDTDPYHVIQAGISWTF